MMRLTGRDIFSDPYMDCLWSACVDKTAPDPCESCGQPTVFTDQMRRVVWVEHEHDDRGNPHGCGAELHRHTVDDCRAMRAATAS